MATYARIVDEQVQAAPLSTTLEEEWLTVTFADEGVGTTVQRVRSSFIPAILYWSWNSTFDVTIDPVYRRAIVRAALQRAADSLDLSAALAGRNLAINVDLSPDKFTYTNRGDVMIFLIAYTTRMMEAVVPQEGNLAVTYRVSEAGQPLNHTGRTEAVSRQQGISGMPRRARQMTAQFLSDYQTEIDALALSVITEIGNDLQ